MSSINGWDVTPPLSAWRSYRFHHRAQIVVTLAAH